MKAHYALTILALAALSFGCSEPAAPETEITKAIPDANGKPPPPPPGGSMPANGRMETPSAGASTSPGG